MTAEPSSVLATIRDELRAILRTAFDGFWLVDTTGRLLEVNEAYCRMSGYSAEELLQMRISDLEDARTSEATSGHLREIMTAGADHFESRHRRKDGSFFDVEVSVIYRPTGGSFIGFVRDITERNRIESALRESEEKYRFILEHSPDPFFVITSEGRYLYVNRAFAEGVGIAQEDIIGRTLWDVFPADEADQRFAVAKQVFRSGEQKVFDVRVPRPDGDHYYQTTATPIRDETGTVLSMVCSSKEITERKRMEEAVRVTSRQYRAIVEDLPVVVCRFRKHGIVTFVNDNYCRAFHVRAEDILGKSFLDLLPEEDRDGVRQQFESLTAESPVKSHERAVLGPDGTVSWQRWTGRAIFGEDGSIQEYQALGEDITERRRSEEALQESYRQLAEAKERAETSASQAQEATAAKSRFLMSMSHEIRTPLNAVLGFSQLMREDPEATPTQHARVEIINRNGEHLLQLLNDILELSRVESGHLVLDPVRLDLHALFGDVVVMFRQRAEAKCLAFCAEGLDVLPRYVVADELRMRQVLINLLGNAVKFTSTGSVCLRVWAQAEETGKLRLRVEVQDTGPGIPADETSRLFEPFEQTASGRQSKQGTGLGLAISRQLARLMGGDVTLLRDCPDGSCFRVEVVVDIAEAEEGDAPVERRVLRLEDGQLPCRILVVDDTEDGRRFVVEMLQAVGFEVLEAESGTAAIDAFARHAPQVILMDNRMPVMDGDETIRRIRRGPGGTNVKIVTVTANATREVRDLTRTAGADDFMAKPLRRATVLEKIRRLTGVRFVHAEDPERPVSRPPSAVTRETVECLPAELRKRMYDATVRGRQGALLQLIAEASLVSPSLGASLRDLASEFDYGTLLGAFEP